MAKLKYTFSLLSALIISLNCFGQKDENSGDENLYAPEKIKDTLVFKGIKVGVNIGRFTDFQFKPERFSYEASIDFNFSNKYFGVIEAGHSEINLTKDNYSYNSNGNFVKVGIDFNLLKQYPSDYLGVGIRIGRADFKQSASNITFENIHWPSNSFSIDTKSHTTYWLEASLGLKGQVLKNVYMGWSALVRLGIAGRKNTQFQPYDIPGFGKGTSTLNLGATYYIYYQIPFNKNK